MSMRRNRNGVRKERIIMLASSALVLTALTVTGVFVRSSRQKEDGDNVVDFSVIESGVEEQAENIVPSEDLGTIFAEVGTDDLDYDPIFRKQIPIMWRMRKLKKQGKKQEHLSRNPIQRQQV